MPYSREFLEEILAESKKYLPGWLYASLMQAARARSGGRASHRVDAPNAFEKLAISEIKPSKLKAIDDADLRAVWLRLHQWFSNAKRRKQPIENIVNAGLWVKNEMESRNMQVGGGGRTVSGTGLLQEIEQLESVHKARKKNVHGEKGILPKFIGGMLEKTPEEVLLVRDFVNIAGSAAVTEKPDDIDVVVRAEYDAKTGKYLLDGTALWVALRRFLTPDKKSGPQMQLLSAPQGSFTDYVPVFDLIARKRQPYVEKIEPVPPDYKEKDRVIKQARAGTDELIAEAEKAKKRDELSLGEFFYQPKPTRAAFEEEPQSIERLVELYTERKDEWLPAFVQKKFDGANHQAHKNGNHVVIYSEDGDDNTDRLPKLADAIRKLGPGKLIIPFELEKWEGGKHLPREAVSGYLAERNKPDETGLIANVYDVIYADKDIHNQPLSERIKVLMNLGITQATRGRPDTSKLLNLALSTKVETVADLEKAARKISSLPGSEGIVAKQINSPYRLNGATDDDWIKYHNATTIKAEVIKAVRIKGGAYTYHYGIRPGKQPALVQVEKDLIPVGETFSTSQRFLPGDKILIEAETVNKIKTPEGVKVTAWVPRVLGKFEGEPDTVDTLCERASKNFVLRTKVENEAGKIEYLPANVLKSVKEPSVPLQGPVGASIAFVGASPGRIEYVRQEPLSGPCGDVFRKLYLEPLGMSKEQVLRAYLVPYYLTDKEGRVREPNASELQECEDWYSSQLEKHDPDIVIALGKTVEKALGSRCDFRLPHPTAVMMFGDSGEVARKIKQVKKRLEVFQKVEPIGEEGGETRGETALRTWEENWYKNFPSSGQGRFVYQHHWRGLDENEVKLTDKQLMDSTEHSVHGDIRLSGNGGLWGFAVFLGRAQDNRGRGELQDKLIDWKEGDNLQLAPKLKQPKEWLRVGVEKPYISKPGEAGATSQKYSKFFALDTGTYKLGVVRKHMVEVFLDGKHLKGRYLFMFAPIGGNRIWLIEKPDDQTPYAEQHDLADVISELKKKKQEFLIWSLPGERPKLIDVQTGKEVRKGEVVVPIAKADRVKKIVYGIVIDPYGKSGAEPDAHNDWFCPSAVEETAHNFMMGNKMIGIEHSGKANAFVVESWIEPYPSRKDYLNAMQGLPHKVFRKPFGSDHVHSGSWGLAVKLGSKEWEAYERGELNAFSPGGFTQRTLITPDMLPEVEFIELVPKEAK